jgi:hypothetical protein
VFSYSVAKLLLKGAPRFDELRKILLEDLIALSRTSASKRVVFVAHNTAICLVQEAIVEWQYEMRPGNVPLGIAAFAVPARLGKETWRLNQWNAFQENLLTQLKFKRKRRYPLLEYPIIQTSISRFEDFLKNLERHQIGFMYRDVTSSGARVGYIYAAHEHVC